MPRTDPDTAAEANRGTSVRTTATAALCRTTKHKDSGPYQSQMDVFMTSLASDSIEMSKVLVAPPEFAGYKASFGSDARYQAWGVDEGSWMRMQAAASVLLKSRFESDDDSPPTKGAEKIAALWPADGDITSVEADGLGSRIFLALKGYYEGKSDDEIYCLDQELDAAEWGGDTDADEPLSAYLARLVKTNQRIAKLNARAAEIKDARWFLIRMRRALEGLTSDNAGGAKDIYADLGRKLAKPREYPSFAPSADPDITKRHLASFEDELADCERAIAKSKGAAAPTTAKAHALFGAASIITAHSPAALNANAAPPPQKPPSLSSKQSVGAGLRGHTRGDGRPLFAGNPDSLCWNCGKMGHTVAFCPSACINNGRDHKPHDWAEQQRQRQQQRRGPNAPAPSDTNGPTSNMAVALMMVEVHVNATDATYKGEAKCELTHDYVDGGSSHSLYGNTSRAVPGSLVPFRIPVKTPNSLTYTEYKGTVITPITRNDGTVFEWADHNALFSSACGNIGLKSEPRMLEAGLSVVKLSATDGVPAIGYVYEGRALVAFDDPLAMPLHRSSLNGLFQIPPRVTSCKVVGDGSVGTYLAISITGADTDTTAGTNMGKAASMLTATTTSETPKPKGMRSLTDLTSLWQARLGFPPPEQLEAILGDTTGHDMPPGAALAHANPTALWRLANQNAAPKRHVSKSASLSPSSAASSASSSAPSASPASPTPKQMRTDPRGYKPHAAYSLDWQQFGPSVSGMRYAMNFVEHEHSLLFTVYMSNTTASATIDGIKAHLNHVRTKWKSEVEYYWHDADTSLLSDAVQQFLAGLAIASGHSPPGLHHKNDKIERKHKPLHRLTVILRFSGRLPPSYWPRAHAMAVEIVNLTPTSANTNGWSPLRSALGGGKPSIRHLRRFGCPAFVFKTHRKKEGLELRSRPTINLGTSPTCPGAHLILDIRDKRVIESAELVFDESFDFLTITQEPGQLTGLVRSNDLVLQPWVATIAEIEADPVPFDIYALDDDAPEAQTQIPPPPPPPQQPDLPQPPPPPEHSDDDDADDDQRQPTAPPALAGRSARTRAPPGGVFAPDFSTANLGWIDNESTVAYAAYFLDMFAPPVVDLALSHEPGVPFDVAALAALGSMRPKRALRLLKGLYGTKQGGRLWHERFVTVLRALGFTATKSDPCCFERWDKELCAFCFIWVDDSFITGSDTAFIAHARKVLISVFGGTDGPINSFLGMHVAQDLDAGTITLNHSAYRRNIFERFSISPEVTRATPDPSGLAWDDKRTPALLADYRHIVAAWMFDAIACAPFALTSLNRLCKRMAAPAKEDAIALGAFMRFMAFHIDTPLVYRQFATDNAHIAVDFTDSNFAPADDPKLRSQSGFAGFTAGNLTNYKSNTQATTAKSTNEAELAAASYGLTECLHKRSTLIEMHIADPSTATPFHNDNNGVVLVGRGEIGLTFRNKHLAARVFNLRDYHESGEVAVLRIGTAANPADYFTKLLSGNLTSRWVSLLCGLASHDEYPVEFRNALGIPNAPHAATKAASLPSDSRVFLSADAPEMPNPVVHPRDGESLPGAVTIDPKHPEVLKVLSRLPPDMRDLGLRAMQDEMETLNSCGTWVWSEPTNKPLACRMVERVKYKGDGSFDKVKMRNVVRGFLQVEGIDFGATYSPTGMLTTARILLALAAHHGWPCFEYDAKNAYCHGVMDVDLWVLPPPGIDIADEGQAN